MIGITSFGAYIPRYRLERKLIQEQMAWYSAGFSKGEKAMANYDEDTVTMAVSTERTVQRESEPYPRCDASLYEFALCQPAERGYRGRCSDAEAQYSNDGHYLQSALWRGCLGGGTGAGPRWRGLHGLCL